MKRKVILLFLAVLMMAMFTNAWATDVIIGTGTALQNYPFEVTYGYSRCASIYLQSEIVIGGDISHLSWYVSTANPSNAPIKIYLKHTSAATLTVSNWATLTTGATLVYDSTVQFSATGWYQIDISDFNYNGTDNLMVLTEANFTGVGAISNPRFQYTSTSANYRTLTTRANNTPPSGDLMLSYFRPNIMISSPITFPPLTGVKTIDPNGSGADNYSSFTDAVNAINAIGAGTGGVTFNVTAGAWFTEEVPIIAATGTVDNPIVFQKYGEGANPIIFPTTSAAGIQIGGGDYITFDGIDININSGQAVNYGYYILSVSGTNGARYNTIKNSRIVLNKVNTSSKGVYQNYGTTPTNVSATNSYNKYQNLTVENCNTGISLNAYSSETYVDLNNEVSNCTFGANSADNMGGAFAANGILANYQSGVSIFNNEIRNITTSTLSSTINGISLNTCYGDNAVYNNKIHDIRTSTSNTATVYGIYATLGTSLSNSVKIYNNMIWNIRSGYTGGNTLLFPVCGMYIGGATATNTYYVDFNSIRIAGPYTAQSAGVYFAANTANIFFRNNIVANYTVAQTQTTKHYCLKTSSAAVFGAAGSISNRNVFYIDNLTNGFCVRDLSSDFAAIQQWTLRANQDGASSHNNPQFTSDTNLFIRNDARTPVESKGSFFNGAISWVSHDINGARTLRNVNTPDIGAHEGDFMNEIPCVAPVAQATDLILIPSPTSISGSFTASDAEAYLVVRHTDEVFTGTPIYGDFYRMGDYLGNGRVVFAGSETTFTAYNLTANIQYYFSVFAYNSSGTGSPRYLVDSALTGGMITLPTAPANPASFTAIAYNFEQINLLATQNAAASNIMVAWNNTSTFGTPLATGYDVDDVITGGGTVLYMGPASGLTNHTDLLEGSTYYYKAWSYITAERTTYYTYSAGLTANATTLVTPVAVPYTQDFEEITVAGNFPLGWTRNGTKWNTKIAPDSYNQSALSGTDYAVCDYGASTHDWMFSRGITLMAGSSYDFSIWYKTDGYTGWEAIKMYIGTIQYSTGMTEIASVLSPNNTTYVLLEGEYNATSTGTYYVGFQVYASVLPHAISFDDFAVDITTPHALAATTPTPTDAAINIPITQDLSWLNRGTITNVDVYFSTIEQLVNDKNASAKVAENQSSPLNSCDLPTLEYGSTYYWRVVAKNDIGDVVDGDVWSFTTVADPAIIDLPYIQTFDVSNMLNGWTVTDMLGDGVTWNLASRVEVNKAASIGYHMFNSLDDWFFSPRVALEAGITYTVSYQYKAKDSSYQEKLKVMMGSSPSPAAMTNLIADHPGFVTTVYAPGTGTFTPDTSGFYYLGVHAYSAADMLGINVDDIRILLPDTQVNQTTVVGGIANTILPGVDSYPTATAVNVNGLGNGDVVNVVLGYNAPDITMPNTGLSFTFSGSSFAGSIVTITHNLGFIPEQIAYRILPNTWSLLTAISPNVTNWNATEVSFTVAVKADGDLQVVFPEDEGQTLPVTLSSFTAVLTSDMFVNIAWVAESETNHLGYNLLRNEEQELSSALILNDDIINMGEENGSQTSYLYSDKEVNNNRVYYYWLESVAIDGGVEYAGPIIVTVGNPGSEPPVPEIPVATALLNAYPNPFNPHTNLRYSMKEAGEVNIEVYNVKGQMIRKLQNAHSVPGYYSILWDGKDAKGSCVSSGVYFYRMTSGKYSAIRKMMMVK